MKYQVFADRIEIFGDEDFCAEHILECGQIFSFKKFENGYEVFSADKKAEIFTESAGKKIVIKTDAPEYFCKFFDMETDYGQIKRVLSGHKILAEPVKFGHGIRILRQDLFETLVSFVVSANNNIKRISQILWRLRQRFGTDMGDFHAFPTREQLLEASADDFVALGMGYRGAQLFKMLRQIDNGTLEAWQNLPTSALRAKLISLSGVGPKVADCVLLFGFGRGDVFPVDTWIEKMFHKFYGQNELTNREKIRELLTAEFGKLSGYAQQYLFFYMRSEKFDK